MSFTSSFIENKELTNSTNIDIEFPTPSAIIEPYKKLELIEEGIVTLQDELRLDFDAMLSNDLESQVKPSLDELSIEDLFIEENTRLVQFDIEEDYISNDEITDVFKVDIPKDNQLFEPITISQKYLLDNFKVEEDTQII
jgi:hypothetical protein